MQSNELKKVLPQQKYDYKSSMFYTTDNNSEHTVENRIRTKSILNSPQNLSPYSKPLIDNTRNEDGVFILKTQEESKLQSEINYSKTLSISSLNCEFQDDLIEQEQSSCQMLDTSERSVTTKEVKMVTCDNRHLKQKNKNSTDRRPLKMKTLKRTQENFTPTCVVRKSLCMIENRRIPMHTKIELESLGIANTTNDLVNPVPRLSEILNINQQELEPKVNKAAEDSINITSLDNCKVATFKINLEDLSCLDESQILRKDASKSSTLILSMSCNPSCGDLNLSTILKQIDEQS